ncbi:MAG: hypothetical protein WAU45_05020 [Blastocatellia bacterium]
MHSGKNYCYVDQRGRREHQYYWRTLKSDPLFATDLLFTDNDENRDVCDASHRNRGNYADHIFQLPQFRTLDERFLRERVRFISQIEFSAPPIPDRRNFPEIASVQVVAYHRLVRFRQFLDQILGGSSRFWSVHRNPSWTSGLIDFQLIEQGSLGSLSN